MVNDERDRWSAEVEAVLGRAGWSPGRAVATDAWERQLSAHGGFEASSAARAFLREFGGLEVDVEGPGWSMARQSFRLDPLVAEFENDRFSEFEERLHRSLYPVGEVAHGHAFLAIDERGALYLLMDDLRLLARSPADGLARLIEGVAPDDRIEP